MNTHSRIPLALLVPFLATAVLVIGCGSGGFEVSVDELDARLSVPDQELPGGFKLDDIRIVSRDRSAPGPEAELDETSAVHAFPSTELLAEFEFQPSGLTFDPPAELQLTLPAPEDGALFEFWLESDDGDLNEYAPVREATFSKDGAAIEVTVEIAHFSGLRIRESRYRFLGSTPYTNRFYQVDLRAPTRAVVGEKFGAVSEVRRIRDLTVWSRDNLPGGVEFKFYTVDEGPWHLQGSWEANDILSPESVKDRPPRSQVETTFTVPQEFTCKKAGTGELRYLASAETGVKFRYVLVSGDGGDTAIVESEEDLHLASQRDWFHGGFDRSEEWEARWAERLRPSKSYGLIVAKASVTCEGGDPPPPTPTRVPLAPIPTPDTDSYLRGLAGRLLAEGYGVTWEHYPFENDPDMRWDGGSGFDFGVERVEPNVKNVGEPFHIRVLAAFDHPDFETHYPWLRSPTLATPPIVVGRITTTNLEVLASHTTHWLQSGQHSLRNVPEEARAVATFACREAGPASYQISVNGQALYRAGTRIAVLQSPVGKFDEPSDDHEFEFHLTCVENSGGLVPTPGPASGVGTSPTSTATAGALSPTRAPATSVDADPVDPCDLVDDEYVIAALGNPVNQKRGEFFGNAWHCSYSAEAQPFEAFWTAFIRVRSHEIDRRFLDGNFFVYRGVPAPHAEFVVLNDDEGLVTDLLAAGAVTTSGGRSLPVSSGDARPDLGSTVLVYKRGTIGGLGAVVTVLAKVPGYHLWLEVVVSMTEPWDVSGIPQDQADAIIASLPRIEEHVPRALELTGLFMDGLLDVQGD